MDDKKKERSKKCFNETEEVISMATISFTKDFSITKRETVEKLEKSMQDFKPLYVETTDVVLNMKRNENKLASMLRSKA